MTYTANVMVNLAIEIDSESSTEKSARYIVTEVWQKSRIPWRVEGVSNNLGSFVARIMRTEIVELSEAKD